MILVDANILLYAEDSLSEHHEAARVWWDEQLSGSGPVALCWPVLTAFIRIGTNARLHKRPLTLKEAVERVQRWLDQPCVRTVTPTDQHWVIFQRMLRAGNATANLVSDAHLAALAVEYNCTLTSTDTDFARFRGLKWRNPVVNKRNTSLHLSHPVGLAAARKYNPAFLRHYHQRSAHRRWLACRAHGVEHAG